MEDPTTHATLSFVPRGTAAEAHEALSAAAAAQPAWEATPAVERGAVLKKLAGLVRGRRVELAWMLAQEQAKLLPLALVSRYVPADGSLKAALIIRGPILLDLLLSRIITRAPPPRTTP